MECSPCALAIAIFLVIFVAIVQTYFTNSSKFSPFGASYSGTTSGIPIAGNQQIFQIVWPILFFFLIIIGWTVFQQEKDYLLQSLYIGVLVLNTLWVYHFFVLGDLYTGLSILLWTVALTGYFLCQFKRRIPEWTRCLRTLKYMSIVFIILYFGWITLASYLNASIVDKMTAFKSFVPPEVKVDF